MRSFRLLSLAVLSFVLLPPAVFSQEGPLPDVASPAQPGRATEPVGEKKPSLPLLSSFGRRNETAMKLFQAGARIEYLTALELKDRGALRQALSRFEGFRILYPGHPGEPIVVRHIVDIHDRLSAPYRALREVRSYLEKQSTARPSPDLLPLFAAKADLEYRMGLWTDAMATSRLIVQAFPRDPAAGRARERLQELQKALSPEPSAEESKQPQQSEKPLPSTPADRSARDESSLDRLGEGLDGEK